MVALREKPTPPPALEPLPSFMVDLTSPRTSTPPHPIVLLCIGTMMLLGFLAYRVLPILDPPYAARHILVSFGLFGLYLAAVWASRRLVAGPWLWLFLLLGLLFHICMLPLAPSMSDDLFRYIWDGRMQAHGVNPFLYPPSSAQLSPFREAWIHPFINHPDYRTVYPPMAQLVFWLGYWLTPGSFVGYKCILLLFQVGLVALLGVWLRRRGKPMGRLLWIAWCPLPLFEVMLDGHLDGLAPMLLVGVLLAAQVRRAWLCGVLLGMALLVKPLPLFVVPLLLWHLRWRRALQLCVACGLTCLLLYLPLLDAGAFLFQSLMAYSKHWSFNGPLFELLSIWFVPGAVRTMLAIGIVGTALITPFVRLPITLEQRFAIPLIAYFFMTPTLYPWYVVWLLPWLVMTPSPWLFWLVGTVMASHFVHHTYTVSGWWRLEPLIIFFEFIPLCLLLGTQVGLYLWKRQRHRGGLWWWRRRGQRRREIMALEERIRLLELERSRGESAS